MRVFLRYASCLTVSIACLPFFPRFPSPMFLPPCQPCFYRIKSEDADHTDNHPLSLALLSIVQASEGSKLVYFIRPCM